MVMGLASGGLHMETAVFYLCVLYFTTSLYSEHWPSGLIIIGKMRFSLLVIMFYKRPDSLTTMNATFL